MVLFIYKKAKKEIVLGIVVIYLKMFKAFQKINLNNSTDNNTDSDTDDESIVITTKFFKIKKVWKYNICCDIPKLSVKSITFDISRYGKYKHKINFNNAINTKDAIKYVEQFLSKKCTIEFFNKVKDDLYDDSDDYFEEIKYRGDLLSDCMNLEVIDVIKEYKNKECDILIECGS